MDDDPLVGQNPLVFQRWMFLAGKIEGDPQLLAIPLRNIERWLAEGRIGNPWALKKWRDIIDAAKASAGIRSLFDLLRNDGERAR